MLAERSARNTLLLTITSIVTVLLLTFHLADDIVRGFEQGGLSNLIAVPICVVWLCGALLLAERRSGHIIILVFSLLGLIVPVIHMTGRGVGPHSRIANSSGAIFFIWTLLAIGVTSLFSVILSVRGLWMLRGTRGKVAADE